MTVEQAADWLHNRFNLEHLAYADDVVDMLKSIRNAALEEAAQVANEYPDLQPSGRTAKVKIAQAIRALKEQFCT